MSRSKQGNAALKTNTSGAAPQRERAGRVIPFPSSFDYSKFDLLDGTHEWQNAVPQGYISYPVRILRNGRLAYFNFKLAKEIGLISKEHPHFVTRELEKKLIETFSLQIINEYDQAHHRQFPKDSIKPNHYMATRYLQLQHANKQGRTSGDGRSIWNGSIRHGLKTWDISSRGTGVTALAPGAVEAQRPLKSGSEDFGYGCGLAEVDELFSSAIMSEIVSRNSVATERMLAIIDLGRGVGIGVRAAQNLVRPAHLFRFLKINDLQGLRKAADYFISRQIANHEWQFNCRSPRRFMMMAEAVCRSYAQFAAVMEREYLFVWLDWDGDNCLANAGILDYGSVRQFGLRHDQYRYEDVDRYSTNLNEQKSKAKLIAQVFVQMADYLQTGKHRSLSRFRNHPLMREFDREFEFARHRHLLHQMGFTRQQIDDILKHNLPLLKKFEQHFYYFEKAKTKRKTEKLPDGINRPAIFNMRRFLREAPAILSYHGRAPNRENLEPYFNLMISEATSRRDAKFTRRHQSRLRLLLHFYLRLIESVVPPQSVRRALQQMGERAMRTLRSDRITGNGIEHVVWEILKQRRRGMNDNDLQEVIDAFIEEQSTHPLDFEAPFEQRGKNHTEKAKLFRSLVHVADSFSEDI